MTMKKAKGTSRLDGSELLTLPVRDRILKTATQLFNEYGIHTTGIDRIIAESGVAKMSFYNHFASKEKLILAYLDLKEEARFENLRRHTIEKSEDPMVQFLGIFESLEDWYRESDFKGCPFVRGLYDLQLTEYKEVNQKVRDHVVKLTEFVEGVLAKQLSKAKTQKLLPQIMTLVIGSTVMALAGAGPEIARGSKNTATLLLKSL